MDAANALLPTLVTFWMYFGGLFLLFHRHFDRRFADHRLRCFGSILAVRPGVAIGSLVFLALAAILPVLTLKLYSLIEQTDITAAEQRTAGVGYSTGILFSFWVLAAAVLVLRSAFGLQVDWGFQFQYPPYVAGLAILVFAFGLSLMGVFEIPALGANKAANAGSKEGVAADVVAAFHNF